MIMKRMLNRLKEPSPPQEAAAETESAGGKHPPPPLQHPKCPRCESSNTKFCYYNNYSVSQPRYFCKGCKRYWTHGGTLRNVPHGGRSLSSTKLVPKQLPSSSNFILPTNPKPQHQQAQEQQQQQTSSTNYYQQGAFESSFNHYSPAADNMMMSSSPSCDFVGSSSSSEQFHVFNQPADMGSSSSCDQFHMFNQPADMGSSSSCDQFHMLNQPPADIMGSTTNLLNDQQQDYWLDHQSSFNSSSSNSNSNNSYSTHTNAMVEQDYDPSNYWHAILGYESPLHSSSPAYFF